MTLEDLRFFVAACEARNLSAVARQLGCTQPAVSQHISRLERELGTALLERGVTGVTPTAAGEELRDAALEGLGAINAGIQRIEELRGRALRKLTITTGGTTVRHFLRQSVVRFRRDHPQVVLTFLTANTTARCLELVRTGAADLALVTVDRAQRGVEQRVMATQDLRLLVPTDDPWAKRKRVKLRELEGMRYIGLSGHTASSSYIEQALAERQIRIEQTMTVNDFDTAGVFVELGLGYAIVPAVQAANFARSAQIRALRVEGLKTLPIGLAARRWASLSKAAKAFATIFRAELKRMSRVPGLTIAPEPGPGLPAGDPRRDS